MKIIPMSAPSNKMKPIPEGTRFGRLTVIRFAGRSVRQDAVYEVHCDCGKNSFVISTKLRTNYTRSCGCLHEEYMASGFRKNVTIHGQTVKGVLTGAYRTWWAMHLRCCNKNHHAYKYYGGRGIVICERWKAFANFFADMGERPVGKTLDRIDSNGNYEPANCRWATALEQSHNSKTTKLSTADVLRMRTLFLAGTTVKELAKQYPVCEGHISHIVHNKLRLETAAMPCKQETGVE